MEPKFQTSFIPKKPILTNSGTGVSVVHETNIFSIVATVMFIVTVLTSGGLFAYKSLLTKQISSADEMINEKQKDLQVDVIQGIVDSNSRIIAAKTLLEKHVVVSKMLQLLQSLTLKKVRFTNLVYENKNNIPHISMDGEVQTYNALAQQQKVFSENEFIKKPQFSDFNLGDNGYITVKFSASVDPMLVSYKKAVDAMTVTTQ